MVRKIYPGLIKAEGERFLNKAISFYKKIVSEYELNENDTIFFLNAGSDDNQMMIDCSKEFAQQKKRRRICFVSLTTDDFCYRFPESTNVKLECFSIEEDEMRMLRVLKSAGIMEPFFVFSDPLLDTDLFSLESNVISRRIIMREGILGLKGKEQLEIEFPEDSEERKSQVDWIKNEYMRQIEKMTDYSQILDYLIKKKIDKNSSIILFGVTRTMEYIYDRLKEQGYHIVAILDNVKRENYFKETPIYTPYEYFRTGDDEVVLITNMWYKGITTQLEGMGYKLGLNVFPVHNSILEDCKSVLRDKRYVLDRYRRGADIYESIRTEFPNQHLLIQPYNGTGDLYLSWLYLSSKNTFKCEKLAMILLTKSCERLAIHLGYQTYRVSADDMDSLVLFCRIVGWDIVDVKKMNYGMNQPEFMRLSCLVDYHTMIQKGVFHSTVRRKAKRLPQISSGKLFEENGLSSPRTILLSPYAETVKSMSTDFWIRLVRVLTEYRFDVCTNVSGEEQPIIGTKGVFIPYNQILDFVDHIFCFIGLRSGLCDLLSSTTGNCIILYTGRHAFIHGSNLDFFGLRAMGLRDEKILEIECDPYLDRQNDEGIIESICDYLNIIEK